MIKTRVVLFFACVVLLGCSEDYNPPNIILIMADDLGYGDLSSYGSTTINTPNIDRLGAEGLRFTDFYSNGPVCSPTRAALLTGKYQQRVGIAGVVTTWLRDSVGMSQDVLTLAEVLKEQGYKTGISGKWHLGYKDEFNPVWQGFDFFKGYVSGNVDYHSHLDNMNIYDWWNGRDSIYDEGYTTDLITRYAIDFISENAEDPFFLYIPHEAPHGPFQGRNDPPERVIGKENNPIHEARVPEVYKEMVEVLDEGVGEVMDHIEQLGLDENTIVIFCSDNGPTRYGSAGGLRGFKASLYEGGIRVPGMIRWSGRINPSVTEVPAMTMDLFPTVLALAELDNPTHSDGVDLTGLVLNQERLPERDLFWEYGSIQAIRRGDWKLIRKDTSILLYNMEVDPSEQRNLSDSLIDVKENLLEALNHWSAEVQSPDTQ